jgi:hypothetical protein
MRLRTANQLDGLALLAGLWLAAGSLHGADIVSDFSAGNEGWVVVDHTFTGTNSVPSDTGAVAIETNPPTDGGRLRVVDPSAQWCWAIAPAKFQGDWSASPSVQADITASSDQVIKYPVVFWIGNGRGTNCTDSAYHLFPLTNTIGGQTATYAVTLAATNWVLTTGSWSNLVPSVREFWIRHDLTSGCGSCPFQETNWLDNVVVPQVSLGPLRIRWQDDLVLLDWTAGAGVSLQKNGSLETALWGIVPGTTGASHHQEPVTNAAVFYRLIR